MARRAETHFDVEYESPPGKWHKCVFIPHPCQPGMWLRIAAEIAVSCSACGADPYVPCRYKGQVRSTCHGARKKRWVEGQ